MKTFVIAAPASGCGKTIVTLALLAALRRRGMEVAPVLALDFVQSCRHWDNG